MKDMACVCFDQHKVSYSHEGIVKVCAEGSQRRAGGTQGTERNVELLLPCETLKAAGKVGGRG